MEHKDLGSGNTAFNATSASDEPLQASGTHFTGIPVAIICAGPNQLHYYFADDNGPLRDAGTSGDVQPGSILKLRVPAGDSGRARIFVQAKYGPTAGAAICGPLRLIGGTGDAEDACAFINELFNRLPASEVTETTQPATWSDLVKQYFLAEEILFGLREFEYSVARFQEAWNPIEKQSLKQTMEHLDKKLAEQLRDFKQLSKKCPENTEAAAVIYSRAQHELAQDQEHLKSIHADPSLWTKATFSTLGGKSPPGGMAKLRGTLLNTDELNGSHSHTTKQMELIAYLLLMAEAQEELDNEFQSIAFATGKEASDTKAKAYLQKLERQAPHTSEMQTPVCKSLAEFKALLALFEKVKTKYGSGSVDISKMGKDSLWQEIGLKRYDLSKSIAPIRQGLLKHF